MAPPCQLAPWTISMLASQPASRTAIVRNAFAIGAHQRQSAAALSIARQTNSRFLSNRSRTPLLYVAQRRHQSSNPPRPSAQSTSDVRSSHLPPVSPLAPPILSSSSLPPPSSPSQSPENRPAPFLRRALLSTSLVVVLFLVGVAMAAQPAAETINAWANPPTDEETLTLFEPTTENAHAINAHIINHPLATKLRGDKGWIESRPHMKIPPAMRQHNLTGGALLGDGKIEVPPLTFSEVEAPLPRIVQMTYLGSGLCGHPNIVHGGLLATMLDEGLARCCFHALPNKIGVTASLKIDYRAPCPGNSYVVLKAETIKVEGRKAWVKGWIEVLGEEDGTGVKLVEAEALFIEPKGAKQMARIYSAT